MFLFIKILIFVFAVIVFEFMLILRLDIILAVFLASDSLFNLKGYVHLKTFLHSDLSPLDCLFEDIVSAYAQLLLFLDEEVI